MASLNPVVTPPNGNTGVEIGISPTAIFSEAIDAGSILPSTCFLVATQFNPTTSEFVIPPASIQSIIEAEVLVQRWGLTLDQEVSTLDFGDPEDLERGLLYRTKITINPTKPLDRNTNYVTILSRDLTKTTVFDPESLVQTGTGTLLSKGTYTDNIEDFYTITILTTGINNTATYVWTRDSDSYTSPTLDTKERFINIDKGLNIKFLSGQFVSGDTYRIRVIPADYLNEFFSWGFATANQDFTVPEDENSNSVIGLPTTGGGFVGAEPTTNPEFYVTKITPPLGASQVPLGAVAIAKISTAVFRSKTMDRAWNQYTIAFTAGATVGSEVVSLSNTDIEIQIEDGVSTTQQIIDAFNASLSVNVDFIAETSNGDVVQEVTEDPVYFNGGRDAIIITIEFNKDIDEDSVEFENIHLIGEPMAAGGEQFDISFTFEVEDNKLIITPIQ